MAKRRLKYWFRVVACSWLFFSLGARTLATDDVMTKKQLAKTIAKVRTGETSTVRTEAAKRLADLTRGMPPKDIDDQAVSDLISLLDTPDDSVRYWVARSLGNVGPRAKIAVPKLQKILTQVTCLQGSKTSAEGIRIALGQIGASLPPPPNCDAQKDPK